MTNKKLLRIVEGKHHDRRPWRRVQGLPSHLSFENDQPHVLIPENEHGIEPGARDVVRLLRQHAENPTIVRFIADMLEI